MRLAPAWAGSPLESEKFDRNAVEIPRYAAIERAFSSDSQDLVAGYLRGDVTARELAGRFKERLQQAEVEAFAAGRRARGIASGEITEAEVGMLNGRHSRNMRYFSGFVRDMERGGGRMDYMKRTDLYARSLWSLYTRGETQDWEEPENINARYYWIMDPDAEHCSDCIDRARRSRDNDGFSWEEITAIGWPGEQTRCMVNCRCHVRTVSKRLLLPERIEDLEPEDDPVEGLQRFIDMLGGPAMAMRIPAAGVPFAKMRSSVLPAIIEGAGPRAIDISRALPTVPKVLTKPLTVVERSNGFRVYIGENGLEVTLGLDDTGQWEILGIVFGELFAS